MAVSAQLDPKVTEAFLLSFPDVLDASVWMGDHELAAHVSLHEHSALGEADLRRACAQELGLLQAPRSISLSVARLRAA